jgi:hypothetical protein
MVEIRASRVLFGHMRGSLIFTHCYAANLTPHQKSLPPLDSMRTPAV